MTDTVVENRAKARRGLFHVLMLRGVFAFGAFAAVAVYGRLIDAKQFGIMAMAVSAITLVGVLRDMGWATSAIQRSTLENRDRDELFWLNVYTCVVAVIALIVSAPFVAHFYGEESLVPVIWVSAIYFFIWGLQSQHAANLRRQMLFQSVLRAEACGILAGIAVGVSLAIVRKDVWALVASNMAQSSVTALMIFFADPWLPGRPRRIHSLRGSLVWGRDYVAQNTLNYLSTNWGQIAVGNRLGALDLGFYNRALQLFVFPQGMILGPVSEVFSPLLSRSQHDDAETKTLSLALFSSCTLIFFPMAAVLPVIADDLVTFVLGSRWEQAARILYWLSPALASLGVTTACQVILTTQGRLDQLRNWSILDFVLRAGGATVGLFFGIQAVAAIPSFLSLVIGAPAIIAVVGMCTRVSAKSLAECLAAPLLMGALGWIVATAADQLLEPLVSITPLKLVLVTAAGLSSSLAMGMVLPQSRQMIVGSVRIARRGPK